MTGSSRSPYFEQCARPRRNTEPPGVAFFLLSKFLWMMADASQVARAWLLKATDEEFERFVENRKFRNPDTGNEVKFVSLPDEEQAKIRAQYSQAVEQQEGAPEKKGPLGQRILEKVRSAVDTTTKAGKNFVKFMRDPEYRKEVKEAFRAKKADFKEKLGNEMKESREMLQTVGKVLSGQQVSDEDKQKAVDQLKDIGKMAVLGTLAVAPLGPFDDILFFVITAGVRVAFPEFSWTPSSWRTPIEASEGSLEDKIAERLYAGIMSVLENPSAELVESTLDEMARRRKA